MMVKGIAAVLKIIGLFLAAGLCEIGGGWFVWKWRKDGWHWGFAILGSFILVGYGIIPTLQESSFGRIYAVYGGVFIALSFLWGWALDGIRPDRWDWVGAAIAVVGVCLIMFGPRKTEDMLPELATPAPSVN